MRTEQKNKTFNEAQKGVGKY